MEIKSLLSHHFIGYFFIRLSDEETEGIWKDPDGKEILVFTNWAEHPNGTYRHVSHHAIMDFDGNWLDTPQSFDANEVLCELT